MGKVRPALDGRLPCHAPSQMLTLTSTAQHCRQSCDLCSHPLSLLPSFQGWEWRGPRVDTSLGGAGQRENS